MSDLSEERASIKKAIKEAKDELKKYLVQRDNALEKENALQDRLNDGVDLHSLINRNIEECENSEDLMKQLRGYGYQQMEWEDSVQEVIEINDEILACQQDIGDLQKELTELNGDE